MATSSRNHLVKVWSLQTYEVLVSFKLHNTVALSLDFDPTGRFLAVGTSNNQVKVYDLGMK